MSLILARVELVQFRFHCLEERRKKVDLVVWESVELFHKERVDPFVKMIVTALRGFSPRGQE